MRPLDLFERSICDYTGRIFVLAKQDGSNIIDFIEKFMRSEVARLLDSRAYRYAGSGYKYLYEEALSMFTAEKDEGSNKRYGDGVLEWAGYTYRLWNWYTGEPSSKIIEICPAKKMLNNWFYGHTVAPELFIEDMRVSN